MTDNKTTDPTTVLACTLGSTIDLLTAVAAMTDDERVRAALTAHRTNLTNLREMWGAAGWGARSEL